jgi:hypothetical protein
MVPFLLVERIRFSDLAECKTLRLREKEAISTFGLRLSLP